MSYHETITIGENNRVTLGIPIGKKLVFFARTEEGTPQKDVFMITTEVDSIFKREEGSMLLTQEVPIDEKTARSMKSELHRIADSGHGAQRGDWFVKGKGLLLEKKSGVCRLDGRIVKVFRDIVCS